MQYNITYRQKDKGWQYIISYKEKGVWKQKSKQGFETKKKAQAAAQARAKELEKQLALTEVLDPSFDGITFLEFAEQLIEHDKLYKEANTIVGTWTAVNKFEGLHNVPIKDLNHMNIQDCVDKLVSSNLKISTIKLYTSKINYILSQAVEPNKILTHNPIGKIKFPSKSLEEQNTSIKALTKSETNDLLDKIKALRPEHYTLTLMAVTTGLRAGELVGLTWNDIDFQASLVDVNKQWKLLQSGDYGFGKVKRLNSLRQVPLPSKTLLNLKEHWEKTILIDMNNRLFPYKAYNIERVLSQLYKKIGYNISIHDLRHTYATNLIANGLDFKTVARLLGHEVEMTMKTYSHVTDEMLKNAANKINKIFL